MSDHVVMRVSQKRAHGKPAGKKKDPLASYGDSVNNLLGGPGAARGYGFEEWETVPGKSDIDSGGEDSTHTGDNPFRLAPWAEKRRDEMVDDFQDNDQPRMEKEEDALQSGKAIAIARKSFSWPHEPTPPLPGGEKYHPRPHAPDEWAQGGGPLPREKHSYEEWETRLGERQQQPEGSEDSDKPDWNIEDHPSDWYIKRHDALKREREGDI